MQKKCGEIACVHLTGVIRDFGRDIDAPDNSHAVLDDSLAGLGKFTVASALAGEIKNDRARRHSLHHLFRYQHWRLLAGDDRSGNHNVALGNDTGKQLALFRVESLILRGAISSGVLRVFGFNRELDKTTSETLHLLFRGWPKVVSRNHGTQPARRRNGLKP